MILVVLQASSCFVDFPESISLARKRSFHDLSLRRTPVKYGMRSIGEQLTKPGSRTLSSQISFFPGTVILSRGRL